MLIILLFFAIAARSMAMEDYAMIEIHKKLITRWLAIALAVLLTLGNVGTASAQSGLASIWQGLWAGANGNIAATADRTAANSTVQARASAPPQQRYAALGDSVAAGVGLSSLSQVPADYARCGRTTQAYPYIVAKQRNLQLNHVACSGATAGDLYTKQRSGSPNLPSQLSVAFAGGKPDLLTITAGANDAQWNYFLRYCYVGDCANGSIPFSASQGCFPDSFNSISTTNLANCYLGALQLKLIGAFWSIQYYSGGTPPKTIVTGYYNPLSDACTKVTPKITAAEIAWMTAEVNALNGTIKQVAAMYPFVTYVPVDFSGHDVCSTDSWVQGVGSPQPFHPTARGQQAIAQAVLGAL